MAYTKEQLLTRLQTKYVGHMKGALSKHLLLKDKKQRYNIVSALEDTKVDLKALNDCDLDKFLNSIGKTPAYVDLEANPIVGKDQPPDLAGLVPSSDSTLLTDLLGKPGTPRGSEKQHISSNDRPTVVTVTKAAKPSKTSAKEKSFGATNPSISYADPDIFVEEILEKTRYILLSEIKEENKVEKNQEQISNNISQQLGMELKSLAASNKIT